MIERAVNGIEHSGPERRAMAALDAGDVQQENSRLERLREAAAGTEPEVDEQ